MSGLRPTELDVAGVGAGPANLSLAALLDPVPGVRARFFEASPVLRWHPGLLLDSAQMQVSFVKDLVTPVDPTSRYSFLAFLAAHQRLYRFINTGAGRSCRREYTQYLTWAAEAMESVVFGDRVRAVELAGDRLAVTTDSGRYRTSTVVLGSGSVPRLPAVARGRLDSEVLHSSQYLPHRTGLLGRRVAVVGGGQSGAEIVADLLDGPEPGQVLWFTRRPNLLPMDESPFANELFNPSYSQIFQRLDSSARRRLLAEQKMASDGISGGLLDRIYRRLYELEFLDGRTGQHSRCQVLPRRDLVGLDRESAGWRLTVRHDLDPGSAETHLVDRVVLATGYEYRLPDCLAPLADRIGWDGEGLAVDADFAVSWDGPPGLRLYAQNAARSARGIADPNLSLLSWRAAVIANHATGRRLYQVDDGDPLVSWAPSLPERQDPDGENTTVRTAVPDRG